MGLGWQEAIDQAEFLMNRAAAGEVTWDSIRDGLAEQYVTAGKREVADFIRAA